MEEHDKNTENLSSTHEETNESSSGCLTWMFILWIVMSIAEGISWLVWMLQGRPDNWYGKWHHFQWKISIGVIIVILIGVVVWLCTTHFSKKDNGKNGEEKR